MQAESPTCFLSASSEPLGTYFERSYHKAIAKLFVTDDRTGHAKASAGISTVTCSDSNGTVENGKVWLLLNPWVILDDVLEANAGGKSMFHLIWYILIGLISGVIAKSVMHLRMTIFWTIVLGIIGSIIGGAVTHMFSRPTNERYHPAGLIFSTLGAILILFICFKLKIHFPQVNPF
jgi:uncharacterized membrane protein YeaQ/YmgE (transglycosylase-associated protein family)